MQSGQGQGRTQFGRAGQVYISTSPDLAKILKNEEGTFEAVHNGVSFLVSCQEGHSIASLVPNGTKNVWLITRQEVQAAEEPNSSEGGERQRARSAGA